HYGADIASLQAVLDHVKDAIVIVDAEGHVLSADSAAARLFAVADDELRGMPIAVFLPALEPAGAALAALATRSDDTLVDLAPSSLDARRANGRSEEHTSELQSRENLVCRLPLEKKKSNPPT